MEVTFKTKAWLGKNSSSTPSDLRTEQGASHLHYTPYDMSSFGDTFVGDAVVTVQVPDDDRELIEKKVEALREEAATIRAEATAKCTAIDAQIQNLLAIEYAPAAADQPATE